ncbi:DUF2958 domain-containing protein [Kitasatospora sp. NPDC002227]|uniref:DUF2958 domain-containing protein n=1 Tax=Kitasatospora sp. NPDC002227 TaxID=3154773 RepID=UPI003330032A
MPEHTEITRPPEVRREERGHDFYPPAETLATIPAIYATEHIPVGEKTVHLHYFCAWGDWYVTEFNPVDGEAFGWTMVGHHDPASGEWGYIDLPALESHRSERGLPHLVERDLDFTPAPAAECLPRR